MFSGEGKLFCEKIQVREANLGFPPNPHSFKNFNEGSKRMFCFAKYLSQSPFLKSF